MEVRNISSPWRSLIDKLVKPPAPSDYELVIAESPAGYNMYNSRPSFNEAHKLRKKNIQQQRKKERFERMRKTRRKQKKEQKRKQKKQNRKGLKYLHADD